MIGRRCTHGNMFSRPVLIARTLSFTGKIKQETRFELICLGVFLSAKYCGGYSGGEPPLPIPNREVKPAIADGTAPPGGRVGSCRSSKTRSSHDGRVFFLLCSGYGKSGPFLHRGRGPSEQRPWDCPQELCFHHAREFGRCAEAHSGGKQVEGRIRNCP